MSRIAQRYFVLTLLWPEKSLRQQSKIPIFKPGGALRGRQSGIHLKVKFPTLYNFGITTFCLEKEIFDYKLIKLFKTY